MRINLTKCDQCEQLIEEPLAYTTPPQKSQAISIWLTVSFGKKSCDFCNEHCLRDYLNKNYAKPPATAATSAESPAASPPKKTNPYQVSLEPPSQGRQS